MGLGATADMIAVVSRAQLTGLDRREAASGVREVRLTVVVAAADGEDVVGISS